MVRLYCFYEELWQHCNLFLMHFAREFTASHSFISTVYSFNSLLSFNLLDWIEGHWIMHVVRLKRTRAVCALWCIFSFILMRKHAAGSSDCRYFDWTPPPTLHTHPHRLKRNPVAKGISLSFSCETELKKHLRLFPCCTFGSVQPQIRSRHRVTQCQLIHHTEYNTSKIKKSTHFPSRLPHYRDTTSTTSITEQADNNNLVLTLWLHCLFSPAWTSSIFLPIVLCTMWRPLSQTGGRYLSGLVASLALRCYHLCFEWNGFPVPSLQIICSAAVGKLKEKPDTCFLAGQSDEEIDATLMSYVDYWFF